MVSFGTYISPNTQTHSFPIVLMSTEHCQNGSKYGRVDLLTTPSSVKDGQISRSHCTSYPGAVEEGNHSPFRRRETIQGKCPSQKGSGPTQELCSRQMCPCSVILPLPFINPSIARRRRGAFTLPPTALNFLSPLRP